MATRLVGNEFDLDLATLAAALLVVVVIAASRGTRAFDTARNIAGGAIASVIVEIGRGGLVVLIRDVGHIVLRGITKRLKRVSWWRYCFERGADDLYWIWRRAEEALW